MERNTTHFGGRHGRRLIGGVLAALMFVSACGNSGGTTPNTNNGNAGNGSPASSETVPPDIPRNLK